VPPVWVEQRLVITADTHVSVRARDLPGNCGRPSTQDREALHKESGTMAANSLARSLGGEFCAWIPSW
jgi:hypothetical protein